MTLRRSLRRSLATTLTLLAAAATVTGLTVTGATGAGAAPAAHAEDDPLTQIIDPNQTQGSGKVVLDRGHVDFGPTLNTGSWKVQIHDDTGSPSYWRNLSDVVLKVNDTAQLEVPDSEQYAFLNQKPGTKVWVVPQTQKSDVVWVGWNTQEPNVLNSLQMGTTLSVLGVDGPGEVYSYLQSGNFGAPEPLWSSRKAFPQESWIETNTHTHANWVFTKPGVYLIQVQFSAQLKSGEKVTAHDTLRFAVGDSTDPQKAFAAKPGAVKNTDGAEKPKQETDAAPEAQSSGLQTVIVWVVVIIAVALVVAVTVVVVASRRAKQRARARRAAKTPEEPKADQP